MAGTYLFQRLELRTFILADEIQMKCLVIVRDIRLYQMWQTGKNRQGKEPVRSVIMRQTKGETDINTRKPDIPGKTIQDTTDRRFDSRQAGQLPVHAV